MGAAVQVAGEGLLLLLLLAGECLLLLLLVAGEGLLLLLLVAGEGLTLLLLMVEKLMLALSWVKQTQMPALPRRVLQRVELLQQHHAHCRLQAELADQSALSASRQQQAYQCCHMQTRQVYMTASHCDACFPVLGLQKLPVTPANSVTRIFWQGTCLFAGVERSAKPWTADMCRIFADSYDFKPTWMSSGKHSASI